MDAFEVNLVGTTYKINPMENGCFLINVGNTVLGSIIPNVGVLGVTWQGEGINNDLAQQIGELIEEKEM